MKRLMVFVILCAWLALPADAPLTQRDALRRAGAATAFFWRRFPSVNCTESLVQLKLDMNGKVLARRESQYDYLVTTQLAPDQIVMEESRKDLRVPARKEKAPFLVTDGFSALLLVFHPFFQGSYEYTTPETELLEGRNAWKIRFRHVRGARSPSCLRLRGRDYPLEWQGTAWIDPATGAVLRITAELESNMEDVGLRSLHASVWYAAVRFRQDPDPVWLPAAAEIDAETPRQHWRNVHQFTNYRQFSVDTSTTIEAPK